MNIETERKFLVLSEAFKAQAVKAYRIAQGYIAHDGGNTVRVRIRDEQGFVTIKGPFRNGISRPEWEHEIPLEDARALMDLCLGGIIDKIRYIVPAGDMLSGTLRSAPSLPPALPAGSPPAGRYFEVDVFHGDNEGLVIAEIELGSPDEPFVRPDWLGQEVTGDKRYYNSHLLVHPYKKW